jgi:DNA polymerase III delta prime subunit
MTLTEEACSLFVSPLLEELLGQVTTLLRLSLVRYVSHTRRYSPSLLHTHNTFNARPQINCCESALADRSAAQSYLGVVVCAGVLVARDPAKQSNNRRAASCLLAQMPLHMELKVVYGGNGCENWLIEGNLEPRRRSGDSILSVEAVAGVAPEEDTFVRCEVLKTLEGAGALSLVATSPVFRPFHGQSISLTLSSLAPLPVYRVRALGSLLVTPPGNTWGSGSQLARDEHVRCAFYALRGHVMTIGCPVMVSNSYSSSSGVPPTPTLATSCLPMGSLGRVTAQTVMYTPRDVYPAWLTLPHVRSRGRPPAAAAAAATAGEASWRAASAAVSAEAFLLQIRDQQALDILSGLLRALRQRQEPGVGARVLLDGPRGCGKTSLVVGAALAAREAEAVAGTEAGANANAEAEQAPRLVVVSCRQLTSLDVRGGSALSVAGALQRRIHLAVALAPSVLLLDAMDCLIKTEGTVDDVAQLLATDLSLAGADVMVVGTCESVSILPARLRGLFMEEVSVAMPTREERWAAARLLRPRVCTPHALARGIWQVEAGAGAGAVPAGQSSVLSATATATAGAADKFFCRADKRIGDAATGQPFVTMITSIARALAREPIVYPLTVGGVGAGADIDIEADSDTDAGSSNPYVGQWVSGDTTLHGHEAAKASITELLVWPRTHAHAFKALNVSSPLGILLYGPPGTGKTLLARVLAQKQGRAFLVISHPLPPPLPPPWHAILPPPDVSFLHHTIDHSPRGTGRASRPSGAGRGGRGRTRAVGDLHRGQATRTKRCVH